jgi:hypothetical protein
MTLEEPQKPRTREEEQVWKELYWDHYLQVFAAKAHQLKKEAR